MLDAGMLPNQNKPLISIMMVFMILLGAILGISFKDSKDLFSKSTAKTIGSNPSILCEPIIEEAIGHNSDSVYIELDGKSICIYRKNNLIEFIETQSITKAITTLGILHLISTGKIKNLDVPVWHFYPSWRRGSFSQVTIRHLLKHRSGILDDKNTSRDIMAAKDSIRYALESDLSYTPGSTYRYSNRASNILSGIVEVTSGMRLDKYIESTLFRSVGITKYKWTIDPSNHAYAMGGLKLDVQDLAKIGRIFLESASPTSPFLSHAPPIPLIFNDDNFTYKNFSINWWQSDTSNICNWIGWCKKEKDPSVIYAYGWLGQYLYIDRKIKLIAIRQKDVESIDFALPFSFESFPSLMESFSDQILKNMDASRTMPEPAVKTGERSW